MSLTLKLASLAIRTLAKPVGVRQSHLRSFQAIADPDQNRIKSRAREHDTFRHIFVNFAQGLHRIDMRMRLGILHDTAAQERMHARDIADAAKKTSDVTTDTETPKDKPRKKDKAQVASIRPLSEARAIELGANFASESFIFVVAAGLIVFERWWSRRKENKKDEHVVERLHALEKQTEVVSELQSEIARLRAEAAAKHVAPTMQGIKAI